MSSYVEYGDNQYTMRALSGVRKEADIYVYLKTGFRGSLPRKKPSSLLTNLTGHSASSATQRARPLTLVQPVNPGPTGDYQVTISSYGVCGQGQSANLLTPAEMQGALDTADAKCRYWAKNLQWNAATTLGELPETMRFLAQTVRELWDYYRLARKGDFLRLSELYRQRNQRGERYQPLPVRAANRYLAWRMAARPLARDIDSVVTHCFSSDATALIRRAGGKSKVSKREVDRSQAWQSNPSYPRTVVRQDDYEVRRVVYVKVDPQISRYKALGFTNLASVLWELTPYSFMVDRILPLGNLIRGMDAEAGLTILSDFRTERRGGNGLNAVRDCFASTDAKAYTRTVNLGFPSNLSNLGSYSPSVDALGLTDALAILVQLRNRRPSNGF